MAQYASFAQFYPYYLSEHSNGSCRRLHVVGTALGLGFLAHAFATLDFLTGKIRL